MLKERKNEEKTIEYVKIGTNFSSNVYCWLFHFYWREYVI